MTTRAKHAGGRPPLPPGEVRARAVRVPVSDAEGAALDAWAESQGRPLAACVRDVTLRAAARARKSATR